MNTSPDSSEFDESLASQQEGQDQVSPQKRDDKPALDLFFQSSHIAAQVKNMMAGLELRGFIPDDLKSDMTDEERRKISGHDMVRDFESGLQWKDPNGVFDKKKDDDGNNE